MLLWCVGTFWINSGAALSVFLNAKNILKRYVETKPKSVHADNSISLQWMHEMKACATITPVSMREESWIVLHHYHRKQSIIIKAIRMRTKWNSFTWNCFIEHSKDNTHQFSHRDISFLSPHQRCHAWYYYGDMGASRPERVIKELMFLQKRQICRRHMSETLN